MKSAEVYFCETHSVNDIQNEHWREYLIMLLSSLTGYSDCFLISTTCFRRVWFDWPWSCQRSQGRRTSRWGGCPGGSAGSGPGWSGSGFSCSAVWGAELGGGRRARLETCGRKREGGVLHLGKCFKVIFINAARIRLIWLENSCSSRGDISST